MNEMGPDSYDNHKKTLELPLLYKQESSFCYERGSTGGMLGEGQFNNSLLEFGMVDDASGATKDLRQSKYGEIRINPKQHWNKQRKANAKATGAYYERFCKDCGKSRKHPLHIFDGIVQLFLFHSCGGTLPSSGCSLLLKLVLYLLMTPCLSFALSVYAVHRLFTELIFDHSFMRLSISKRNPLIKVHKLKVALSTYLFFFFGSLLILAILTIPIFLTPLVALFYIYAQLFQYHSVR